MVDRRTFLRHLLALPIAATLDVEKMLWIPRTIITVPTMPYRRSVTMTQIIELELARLQPRIKDLFERDDIFYKMIR
jgi:hypothetical protein